MTFWGALYKLILGPLELLFDVVYSIGYQMTGNPGLAIILLSLAINLLILPLYLRADALQEEEKEIAARLKPRIDQIKEAFTGDERFMMLQTYFRQNNYKPYYALRGSISLLLQIPFFMAAYNYLSNLSLLHGVSFGPIADLAAPDGILKIGGMVINLLPILMTLINIVSGIIYTRGMPLKSKIQLYGMALLFLVLLYDSPSGLVFYWTLNNVFSLIKNIFYKLPNPKKVIRGFCSAAGIVLLLIFCVIHPVPELRLKFIVAVIAVILQLPLLSEVLSRKNTSKNKETERKETKTTKVFFYSCCVLMTFLWGFLIPSAIINASPGEFVELVDFKSPLRYLVSSGLLAAGTFLIWCVIFYRLSSERAKRHFSLAAVIFSAIAIIDYMFFGKGYGNLSPLLRYDISVSVSRKDCLINLAAIAGAVGGVVLLWRKKPEILKAVCIAGCVGVVIMSGMNVYGISKATADFNYLAKHKSDDTPRFVMSKKGKNVVVIMLDRAISAFVPYMFEERPEVAEQFRGFTYYPNTLSYGAYTNVGAPAVFGGYEYRPFDMNDRPELSLREKHNEALKLMPLLFRNQGYDVTVCDLPYANYEWIPDLSIFDEYPEIHKYITHGAFGQDGREAAAEKDRTIERNLFCYSLFRSMPVVIQKEAYDEGRYYEAEALNPDNSVSNMKYTPETPLKSTGINREFVKAYRVLQSLPIMTVIEDSEENTFLELSNCTTHDVLMLQEPEFEPRSVVDNTEYENEHKVRTTADGRHMELNTVVQMEHFQDNMAAFIQLGKWFDYLRENDLWDNTRIIIVSDHGRQLGLDPVIMDDYEVNHMLDDYEGSMIFNSMLMIKDFGSNEFKTDMSFMTTADTPTETMKGLIENPVNPATGNPVNEKAKEENEQYAMWTLHSIPENNGNAFVNPTRLILRNHYLFDYDNWEVAN